MQRRRFLTSLLAAPAIIRSPGLLMPIKPLELAIEPYAGMSIDESVLWVQQEMQRELSKIMGIPYRYLIGDVTKVAL